jgi:hypothetical protein
MQKWFAKNTLVPEMAESLGSFFVLLFYSPEMLNGTQMPSSSQKKDPKGFCQFLAPENSLQIIFAFLTLTGLGEVKVNLTNFDLKLQENSLSTLFFETTILAETSSKSL